MLSQSIVQIPDIEILKVGHHGSSSSSCQEFLELIEPELAIYMAGVNNSYGHPHNKTIQKLADLGTQVLGTDINGTIVVNYNRTGYTLTCEKGCEPSAILTVSQMQISPKTPHVGEIFTIQALISSQGTAERTYLAVLTINDTEVDSNYVVVGANEDEVVTFTYSLNTKGTYTAMIGDVDISFTITGSDPPPPPPPCSCSSDKYNCSDFSNHTEAQACYDYCRSVTGKDIHHLDGDNDGSACESLTSSPSPSISPTPPPPPTTCSCTSDKYNCSDFSTHAEAQACYTYCLSATGRDVHRLDGDKDGSACESLP